MTTSEANSARHFLYAEMRSLYSDEEVACMSDEDAVFYASCYAPDGRD